MTKKEIDLISSRGQGTHKQVYYDELGNRYIGLINGRIVRDQVSVANIATTATTAENAISSAATSTTGSTGTVTSVQLTAGTAISLFGTNPITSSGNITITNTAPDQTVSLVTAGSGLVVTGIYPNFTLQNTLPDQTVAFTNGTGISVTGTYPNFTITNTSPFTGAITSLNGLTASTQTFATGTAGSDFNISSVTSTHTFNIPDASASARGLITTAAQTLAGTKTFSSNPIFSSLTQGSVLFAGSGGLLSESNLNFYWDSTNKRLRVGDSVTNSLTTTPPRLLTLYQGVNNHSVLLCGQEYTDPITYPVSTMDGILFTLGVNRPGNRQLWIGDSTALGNTGTGTSAKAFFRYLTGGPLPSIDGIRGDGSIRLPVNIGTNSTNTAIGFEWTGATGTTLPASRLTIYGNLSIGNSYISIAAPSNGASIEGNVIIGTSTDSGYKLDINGTARIQNKLTLGNSIIASGTSEGTSGQVLTSNGTGAIPSWTTIAGTGTVTSVSALTLTTTGTDLTSTVANSTTTPVITLNVPTASATNRGALSSTDWTTFNNKQAALTLTTTGTSGAATLVGSTLNIPQYSGGGMSIGGSITSATAGSVLFAGTSGVLAQDNSNLFWDNTNKRLGIATASPTHKLHVSGSTTASAASAIGVQLTPTLVASANGDVLTALNISPTFTNGGFTGLSNIGLRINNAFTLGVNASSGSGEIKALTTNVDFLGLTGNTGSFNFYGGGAYNTGAGVTVGGSSHATYANVIAFWRSGFVQNARFTTNGNLILGTGTADAGYKLDNSGTSRLQGLITLSDGVNFTVGSTNGTKIGQSSTEKLGFWNVTPIVQPTTATTAATRVGGGGTALTDTDTFDGYTIAKVVKALRNAGILQ